jgi:hypothetical protein
MISILSDCSPEFDPGLLLDALQRLDRDVTLGVGNGNPAFLASVFELFVAADMVDFIPAILKQLADNIAAAQTDASFTGTISIIHTKYTSVNSAKLLASLTTR